ncbi:MAG: hypothetical protein ABI726_02735 [bacterium]
MDVYQRRRLVAVLAVVLVLVLIGVAIAGGGDDEQTPITPVTGASTGGLATPLSKSEFISQGDAICEETAAAVANIDAADTKEQAEQELDYTNSELDQLRSLTPPESDQATLDDFFSSLEDLIGALEKESLAADRDDATALAEAQAEIDSATSAVLEAAADYGFKKCGKAGKPSTAASDTVPVEPATTPPATTPPATTPAPAPPSNGGGSGGVSPGSGGVSP